MLVQNMNRTLYVGSPAVQSDFTLKGHSRSNLFNISSISSHSIPEWNRVRNIYRKRTPTANHCMGNLTAIYGLSLGHLERSNTRLAFFVVI